MDNDSNTIDQIAALIKRINPNTLSPEEAKLRVRFLTRASSIKFKVEEYVACQALAGEYGSRGSPKPSERFANLLSDNPQIVNLLDIPKMNRLVNCGNRTTGRTKKSIRMGIERYRLMKKGTIPPNNGFLGEFLIVIRYAIKHRHTTNHVQGNKVDIHKKMHEIKKEKLAQRRHRAARRIVLDASSK